MKNKHILYLLALATMLCLTGCDSMQNASMHMMGEEYQSERSDGYVSPESGDYKYSNDEEDSRSFEEEEIEKETDRRLEEYRKEREASEWYQLEVAGGFHKYVPTKYSKECTCYSLLRPFKCTKGYIVMLCEECYDTYLLPGKNKRGGETLVRPTSNTIKELDCELFAASETGWAADKEVKAYDWSRNEKAYNKYLKK